jgi:predicted PurR-regulated permease PerM
VLTLIVLLVLRMPYPVALALLAAVLDLVPLVGATLGGALLVIVGFFVSPLTAVILLVYSWCTSKWRAASSNPWSTAVPSNWTRC